MQSSGSFFTTVQDDVQGSLLSTFALPLSMEDDPGVGSAVTSAADSASLNGMESFMGGGQYGTSYPGAYNYHDPLQAAMISAQFHDFEKEKRNDQMKLTFIMDSGASGSRGPAELRTTGASSPITPSAAIVKSENITASLFPVQPLLPLLPSHPAPISPITSEPATLVTSQSNKRMQSCSACGQVFSIKSKALYHLYMQHPQSAPAKVFPCTSCENAFARKSDMVRSFFSRVCLGQESITTDRWGRAAF